MINGHYLARAYRTLRILLLRAIERPTTRGDIRQLPKLSEVLRGSHHNHNKMGKPKLPRFDATKS